MVVTVVALTTPRLWFHELWRDEAWLWSVARQSATLGDLFPPLARSGQGALFPVLAWMASLVSTSPRALQALHLGLVVAAAAVFWRQAPLSRLERTLFLAGYFPAYEYAVLSRHYAAGVLLLWLALAAMRTRRPALGVGLALGLLCQTTVYGCICAIALACGWVFARSLRRDDAGTLTRSDVVSGTCVGLAGAVAGLLQIVPLEGTSFAPGWTFDWNAAHARDVVFGVWRAMVPLPWPTLHFWNVNILEPWTAWHGVAGVAAIAASFALLWRRPVALFTFGIGALGLLAFGYIKYVGLPRHQGHWWLLLMAALWLDLQARPAQTRPAWQRGLLVVILATHVVAAAFASAVDLAHPFSNGLATADLLRAEGLEDAPLFGHREPPAATVALGLDRPLFSPSRGVYATHPDWGPGQRELPDAEVRCAARALARREGRDVVFVANRALPAWAELVFIGARTGAIVESEDFHVYRLMVAALATTAADARCPLPAP